MTIEITERSIGIWQCAVPGGDWLAHLGRDEQGFLILDYRFRWYRDDNVWDSQDIKRWYRVKAKLVSEPVEEMIDLTRKMWEGLASLYPSEDRAAWEILRGGRTVEEFTDLLTSMAGTHTQHIPAKESPLGPSL